MPFSIIPTTELEAVNECLENIGQAPVSTISGDLGVDTEIALNFVRKTNRELQSAGWYWNIEVNYPLTPDGAGDILLPSNTLAVDTVGVSRDRNVVQRGQRLYDKDNFTYDFGTEVLYVELTVGLTFEELPETARRYIAMRAARLFQNRIEATDDQGDAEDERRAMVVLMQDQLRTEDSNINTGSLTALLTLRRTAYY
jgi:hypothetical protein